MNSFILSIVTKIASVAIPVSLIMMLFTENIIALLYQRGKFTASDTVRTAKVLLYYLPATFFMSASLIVVRAYYSMKNTVLPLVISTTSVIICIPLYFYFGRRLGAGGIALTTTISLCVTFFSLIFVWKVVYKIDHLFRFFRSLILIGIIALIGYCLCGYLKSITTPFFFSISSIFIKNLLIVISNTIPSLVIVAILLQVTGVCNVKSMIERIVKRFLPEKNR